MHKLAANAMCVQFLFATHHTARLLFHCPILQAAQSEAARESELYRPAAFSALAPELLELYSRAMTLGGAAGGAAGKAALSPSRRRRSSRGTVDADAEEAAAAAAAAEVAAEEAAFAEGPTPALGPEPALSDGFGGDYSGAAPFSAGGFGDADFVEDTQPAAEAAEGEGEGFAAAERRGRLALQPVASSGELASIGGRALLAGWLAGSAGFARSGARSAQCAQLWPAAPPMLQPACALSVLAAPSWP